MNYSVLCLAPTLLLSPAAAHADSPRPNIVLVIGDDQGWGDYGFMGHPHVRTPNLDRLAAQGLSFAHGYVPSSLCRPSLATMITGLFPHQHGITSNDPPLPRGKTARQALTDPAFLAQRREMIACIDKVPTLPRLLAKGGYVSHQSGKWWEGDSCRCGGFTAGMTHGDPARGGRHGDAGLTIGRAGLKPVFDFIDGAVAERKPFYVWYAPMMPHEPHNPPKRLLAHYEGKAPLYVARYWAMCEWFDETCGQLLEHLEKKGAAENTLVIYLADNGWIQSADRPGFAAKSKRSPYDGGIRTPVVLRWPGRIRPRKSPVFAHSIDLAPTILAAAGLPATPEMQGVNLRDEPALLRRKVIYGEVFTHNAVDVHDPAANLEYRWIIDAGWKLIWPNSRNVPGARPELYDLLHDPGEEKDRAAQMPREVERMQELIAAWWPAKARPALGASP